MARAAFIGLGVMGYPMAGHIAKGGHEVTVYNRTNEKSARWVAEYGGKSAPTPAEAAQGQDFVFSCVGNDDDLRSVTTGPDGAFSAMKPGSVQYFLRQLARSFSVGVFVTVGIRQAIGAPVQIEISAPGIAFCRHALFFRHTLLLKSPDSG